MKKEKGRQTALIPLMVDDPTFSESGRAESLIERRRFLEDQFLDGPATGRVAVLDLDEETGTALPPVRYVQPRAGRVQGYYALDPDPKHPDPTSRAFNGVSTFATVLSTIHMFEHLDVLGRQVRWAFDTPELLVVPRAGQWENARYVRDSHRVEFYFFPSHQDEEEMIYTSLARDIVAHETGHAILDGIAPRLWFAFTPQSRALHETIADLTALLVSIDSRTLRLAVLKKTKGSIEQSTHFSALAEQFGMQRGMGALRNLYDPDLVLGPGIRDECHDLCRVLEAALYSALVKMHADRKQQRTAATGKGGYEVSGWALATAANQFCRMTMRALDYMPPGEVSFADYGRAIIASDQAAHPDDEKEREWLRDEFVRRKMVQSRAALIVDPPPADALKGIDLQGLMASDQAAFDFADGERGRDLLSIPKGVQFQVEPRLLVERVYYHRGPDGTPSSQPAGECLFKVLWYEPEESRLGSLYSSQRPVVAGTTLAWDRDTGKPRALLTTSRSQHPDEHAEQKADRDAFLARLADEGALQPGPERLGPDGRPLPFVGAVEAASRPST